MSQQDMGPKSRKPKLPNSKTIMIIVIVIAVIGILVTSFFIVDETEHAVVLRLGKYNRTVGSGLNFKLPLGIEQNRNVATEVYHTVNFGQSTEQQSANYRRSNVQDTFLMLTGDLNIIDIQWAIQFRIIDPRAWLYSVEDQEQTISDISQSVINVLVGDRAIMEIMSFERNIIEQRAQEQMNEIFQSYNLGILVTTVQLKSIIPPRGEVQDAFEDVNIAEQDMERYINQGLEEYNQEIPRARGEAAQMIQVARGYAAERVNQAEGDVARFKSVLTEYEKAKDVTRSRLYLEMMEEILSNSTNSDLIDRNLDNFLPLKNFDSQGGSR